MADDFGVLYTDKQLRDVERTISHLYGQAQKDIAKKLEGFTQKAEKQEKAYAKKVADGKMTQEALDKWKAQSVFQGKQWTSKMNQVSSILANVNDVANNIVRNKQIGIFSMNANYAAYDMEHGFGVSFGFDLYDQNTVARLLKDKPNILPFKKLDKQKDVRWNFKNIRSQVTQGIVQGESIPKIAKRLSEVVPNRNESQMVLHARTAMTAAQNGGRMERFREAEELGIKLKKVWLATHDGRTRDTHIELDGQAVKPDEPFEVDGMEIMYPGDPLAEPELVYNCRCTLTTELEDYPRRAFSRFETDDGQVIEGMTYHEWEKSKKSAVNGTKNEQSQQEDVNGLREQFKESLTKEEMEVVGKYQSQSFEFNQKLRSGEEWGRDQASDEEYAALDRAIAKGNIEKDAIVYRGVSGDVDAFFDLEKGDIMFDHGYCSVSYDRDMALRYGDEVLFEIKVKKGQPGAFISHIADVEGNTFEANQEILLPRNAKFKVVEIKEVENKWENQFGNILTSKQRIIELVYEGVEK